MRFRRDERGLPAQYFRPRGGKFGARPLGFGLGRRAVELDQNVACLDQRAVGDTDVFDPAGLHRLDDLDPPGRLELALRGGDDVDPAEIGPDQRRQDEGADDPQERDMDRRGRRFQDLERRRQEFPVAEIGPRPPEPRQRRERRGPGGATRRFCRRDGPGRGHAAISAG